MRCRRQWLAVAIASSLLTSACSFGRPAAPEAQQALVLMLGEVHDNAAGHRERLALLSAMVADGWQPALVMEQFDREQQAQLTEAQRDCDNADCLIDRVGRGGWDWPLYRPLFQLALDRKLPLIAGNVSRSDAGRVVHEGLGALFDEATMTRFHLREPLPADLEAEQARSVIEGHCHRLPPEMTDGMVAAQVARDVWMAYALVDAVSTQGSAVLIAGNGHVRRDVGVIRWLPPELARRTQTQGFVESGSSSEVFDVVHIVPPQQRPDPCEAFSGKA